MWPFLNIKRLGVTRGDQHGIRETFIHHSYTNSTTTYGTPRARYSAVNKTDGVSGLLELSEFKMVKGCGQRPIGASSRRDRCYSSCGQQSILGKTVRDAELQAPAPPGLANENLHFNKLSGDSQSRSPLASHQNHLGSLKKVLKPRMPSKSVKPEPPGMGLGRLQKTGAPGVCGRFFRGGIQESIYDKPHRQKLVGKCSIITPGERRPGRVLAWEEKGGDEEGKGTWFGKLGQVLNLLASQLFFSF